MTADLFKPSLTGYTAGTTAAERLARMYAIEQSGCWRWTGDVAQTGYGRLSVGNRRYLAHRLMYELVVGPIPAGLTLDHLCRNRACVNPKHLEPVTNAENVQRGEKARLSYRLVEDMQAAYAKGESTRSLALRFGVSRVTVSRALRGLSWARKDALSYLAGRRLRQTEGPDAA